MSTEEQAGETGFAERGYVSAMENSVPIQCPFCGEIFDLVVDTSVENQRFTTDCEVCCRPFEVTTECEGGQVVRVEVDEG